MGRNMFVAVVLLAGSIACASAPTTDRTMNLQLITQQEIERTTAQNEYEIVRKLRPKQNNPSGLIAIKTK